MILGLVASLGCGRARYTPENLDAGPSGLVDAATDALGTDAFTADDAWAASDAAPIEDAFSSTDTPTDAALSPDAFADPCSIASCSPNATCSPSGGVAVCTCNSGFIGTGMVCSPTPRTAAALDAYIKASNTDSRDAFGYAVALSADGNTMAIGAAYEDTSTGGINPTSDESGRDAGAVYVYRRIAAGWVFDAFVKAANPGGSDWFGFSVSLSADGTTLAVGSTLEGSAATGVGGAYDEGAVQSGAAYVYRRSVAGWSQEAFIKASNTEAHDQFGWVVELSADGNTLAVGAPYEDGGGTRVAPASDESAMDSGAVYVYRRTGSLWAFDAYIKASNTGRGDQFGWELALSPDGNTLAVGAPNEDGGGVGINPASDDAASNAGAVYVYARGTAWAFNTYIKASNTGASDDFGVALSLSNQSLAVGAIGEASATTGVGATSNEGALNSGAVYIYALSGGAWVQQAFIKPMNTGAGDYFGWALALNADGSVLAVGARYEDSSGTGVGSTPNEGSVDSGAVYLFTHAAGAWAPGAFVKASNTDTRDEFGFFVALSGDGTQLCVGAQHEDGSGMGVGSATTEGSMDSGAAYVYR